ncbi:hypothetical protein [Thermocatellispora tengchongensis]|uniref:hypothetical protein n=1 Tax=Thermocatellispora tengchongensis TaxID=1073253 RepID=UPI0036385DEA
MGGLPRDVQRQQGPPGAGGRGERPRGPRQGGELRGASLHGAEAAAEQGSARVRVCPFWRPAYDVEVPGYVREGHGGADARMAAVLFGGDGEPDPLGRSATERDGALSLLTGLAGNQSLDTGAPVRVADLLDLTAPAS